MTTIADIEDVFLGANAEIEEWKTEFLNGFFAPKMKVLAEMTKQKLRGMPPQVQDQLRSRVPTYDQIVGGKNNAS